MVSGQLQGLAQQWHENGSRKMLGEFIAGQRNAAFFAWKEDGTLDQEVAGIYVGGVRSAPLGEVALTRASQLAANTEEVTQ
jgi:hypothetical protein